MPSGCSLCDHGEVIGERCRASEYQFETEQGSQTLPEIASEQDYPHLYRGDDDEDAEYLVPVHWLHTVSRDQAFSEVGLFGNQNTVCKPTTPKWSHTVNRLQQVWQVE